MYRSIHNIYIESIAANNKMNIYVKMDEIERHRKEQDYILRLFLHPSLELLNNEIKYVVKTCPSLRFASDRLKGAIDIILAKKDRSSKHAFITFAMYNDRVYRESLIQRGEVNVVKFQNFYDRSLKKATEDLLCGRLICLQDYIEHVRSEYILS